MWAWDRTMVSMLPASKGNERLRSKLSRRRPWYSPQSSRMREPLTVNRCIDPVTVRTAPKNCIFMA